MKKSDIVPGVVYAGGSYIARVNPHCTVAIPVALGYGHSRGIGYHKTALDPKILTLAKNMWVRDRTSDAPIADVLVAVSEGLMPNAARDNAPEGWVWTLRTPREFYATWEVYTAERDAKEKADKERQDRAKVQKDTFDATVASLVESLAVAGVTGSAKFAQKSAYDASGTVTLTFDQLKQLLDRR
jgi:hypothetical protein